MTFDGEHCPYCGAELSTSGRYCLDCGRGIPAEALPDVEPQPEPERRLGTGFLRLPGTGRLHWPGDPR
jgi:tRNA(Ile2) C34 agmatinyltransferase TiaS